VRIPRPDASGDDTLKQVEEEYPSAGRGGLPVKDVGRLLLRCADRPGLVAAVSAFLADAGANIVSLDQHAT
jgi:formyltetrahydrofolate deformylase